MSVLDSVLQYKARKEAQDAQAAQAIPMAVQAFITGRQQQIENQQKNMLMNIQAAQAGYKIDNGNLVADPTAPVRQKSVLDSLYKQSQIDVNTARASELIGRSNNQSGVGDTSINVDTPEGQKSYIGSLPENIRPIVDQLVKGEMRVGDLQRIPPAQKQQILNAGAYLGLNTNKVETMYKTRKDFSPGGKIGVGINAANTVIGHLNTLSDDLAKLNTFKEGSFGPLTGIANKAKVKLAGETGKSEVASANTSVDAVANEMMRVYRQVGASTTEIEEWKKNFPTTGTPEQQQAAINTAIKLLGSKTNTWRQQWEDTFGSPMEKNIFTPEAQNVLKRFGHEDLLGEQVSNNENSLDQQTALKFLNQAGGDKQKARLLAKQAGYKF